MRKIFLPLLLSVMFMLAACGGGGVSTSIEVTMTDFLFTPDNFTVPAGKEISITAVNSGAVAHDFVIFKLGTNVGDHFEPEDEVNIFWEVEVMPGGSKSATFTAPVEPGEYYITCRIPGHHEAGMNGKLIVVAAE